MRGLMWTKRYITHPTKEEYFKTKHPILSCCMLTPLWIYYLICLINDINDPWMLVGMVGCLTLGVGLVHTFAILLKVYNKRLLPRLCNVLGTFLIVISLIFAWK